MRDNPRSDRGRDSKAGPRGVRRTAAQNLPCLLVQSLGVRGRGRDGRGNGGAGRAQGNYTDSKAGKEGVRRTQTGSMPLLRSRGEDSWSCRPGVLGGVQSLGPWVGGWETRGTGSSPLGPRRGTPGSQVQRSAWSERGQPTPSPVRPTVGLWLSLSFKNPPLSVPHLRPGSASRGGPPLSAGECGVYRARGLRGVAPDVTPTEGPTVRVTYHSTPTLGLDRDP